MVWMDLPDPMASPGGAVPAALVPLKNHRSGIDQAFSPTADSADLKATPHPPIPQYPSGFFARYCW